MLVVASKYVEKEDKLYTVEVQTGQGKTLNVKKGGRKFTFGPTLKGRKVLNCFVGARSYEGNWASTAQYFDKNVEEVRAKAIDWKHTQTKTNHHGIEIDWSFNKLNFGRDLWLKKSDRDTIKFRIINNLIEGRPVGLTVGELGMSIIGYDFDNGTFIYNNFKNPKIKSVLIADVFNGMDNFKNDQKKILSYTFYTDPLKSEKLLTFESVLENASYEKYESAPLSNICNELSEIFVITFKIGEGVDPESKVSFVPAPQGVSFKRLLSVICEMTGTVTVRTGEMEVTFVKVSDAGKYAGQVLTVDGAIPAAPANGTTTVPELVVEKVADKGDTGSTKAAAPVEVKVESKGDTGSTKAVAPVKAEVKPVVEKPKGKVVIRQDANGRWVSVRLDENGKEIVK
jgi:hypothetical protein